MVNIVMAVIMMLLIVNYERLGGFKLRRRRRKWLQDT